MSANLLSNYWLSKHQYQSTINLNTRTHQPQLSLVIKKKKKKLMEKISGGQLLFGEIPQTLLCSKINAGFPKSAQPRDQRQKLSLTLTIKGHSQRCLWSYDSS